KTNRKQNAKKPNAEQLQVTIDENPTCTTGELSKTSNASRHLTVYRKVKRLGWKSPRGWQMYPTWEVGFIRNQTPMACDLLCFTASS
ncbi:unnamed protein product, partial [Hymenolepis diminuta]